MTASRTVHARLVRPGDVILVGETWRTVQRVTVYYNGRGVEPRVHLAAAAEGEPVVALPFRGWDPLEVRQ